MKKALTREESVARSDWNTTLGELCDRFGGGIQTGPFGSQLHASDYSEDGTPVVMPQDLVNGKIVCDQIARVPEKIVRDLSRHALRLGDVVFSRRGDVTRFAVVTDEQEGWLCGTGCIRIRLNCPEVNIPFFQHYLQQRSVGKWLIHQAKGVTMPNLNTDIVRALPFVYPPLAEQRRIAAILDKADALRQKRRLALQKLDSLTQSLFLNMFGDPAINPRKFPLRRLGELAVKFSDGPFGSNLKTEHYTSEGVRVVRLQNIGVGEFLDEDKAYISERHSQALAKHECRPGDVLVGTLGAPNLRACIHPAMIVRSINKADCVQIRPDPNVATAEFICSLLNVPSVERMASGMILGQTRSRIAMGRLRELKVPVPPISTQRDFTKRWRLIKCARRSALKDASLMMSLWNSLQQCAFRGEL
jgi:type I restriction enzyme S subunit